MPMGYPTPPWEGGGGGGGGGTSALFINYPDFVILIQFTVCYLDDLGTNATNSTECGDGIMAADIPNGMLCYTGLTPGSTATYSCDKGYELSGTSVLQCQCNGTWNGTASNCMEPNTGLFVLMST